MCITYTSDTGSQDILKAYMIHYPSGYFVKAYMIHYPAVGSEGSQSF